MLYTISIQMGLSSDGLSILLASNKKAAHLIFYEETWWILSGILFLIDLFLFL